MSNLYANLISNRINFNDIGHIFLVGVISRIPINCGGEQLDVMTMNRLEGKVVMAPGSR